ncbi:hypothetical protein BDV11DRAFT_178181 [Aspergillus similis]
MLVQELSAVAIGMPLVGSCLFHTNLGAYTTPLRKGARTRGASGIFGVADAPRQLFLPPTC